MRSKQSLVIRLAASTVLSLVPAALHAQQSHQESDHAGSSHASAHDPKAHPENEIVVTGHPPVDFGILSATASIAGDDLHQKMRGQIGEVLASLPGVSATSFAPGASRPVLRGFSGDRVTVLTDGIGAIDASNVSEDHAVVFDALSVDHIDVFHGPSVLLFGGNAIGGAVNALDKRIPRHLTDRVTGMVIGSYGTAADERAIGGAIDIPIAPKLVAHFDANWRKSDDLRVGGFVHSSALRADLLSEAAEHAAEGEADEAAELTELAGLSGRVPSSAARSYTWGAGVAYIDSRADIGISVQRYDTRYGVPLRPGTEHHHEDEHGAVEELIEADHGDENVSIDLEQTRFDIRGGLKFDGPIESLQFRGTYGDYEHVEFEGDEVGTRFSGDGFEIRADLVQADRNGWRGRSGIQYFERELKIVGAEAFQPDNRVSRFGVFTLQAINLGENVTLEAAGRYERAKVSADTVGFSRSFDLWSGATGLSWQPADGWTVGLNYVHGARAPSPEELLSDGLHVATQAYEIGNSGFVAEKSNGFEGYLRFSGDRAEIALTGYVTRFDNFIAALRTSEEREGFAVFEYAQLPARYKGFEASGSIDAARWDNGSLKLEAGADYVRARLKGVGPVPRIPPLRLSGGLEIQQGDLRVAADVEWNARQSRVASFEEPVAAFTLVGLSADWHPQGNDGPLTLILAAENLFDVTARRAASYTRDFVPLAGRDVRLTARFAF